MNGTIYGLADYAIRCGLLQEDDRTWAVNRLLEVMRLDAIEAAEPEREPLHVLLERLTEDAVTRGICADDQVSRDLFDTKLMGTLTPAPHEVREKFRALYDDCLLYTSPSPRD